MKRKGWSDQQRKHFRETMRQRKLAAGMEIATGIMEKAEALAAHNGRNLPDPGPLRHEPQPESIFILLNGKLQRFQLRTMPVYVPAQDLDPHEAR